MHLKALSLLYMFVGTNAAASDGHLWVPRGTRGFESLCPASADPRIGTWNNGNMSESSLFKHVSLEQAILLAGETVLTRSLHKAYSQELANYRKSWSMSQHVHYIMFRVEQSDQQVLAKLSALQTAVLPNPGQKKRNKLQVLSELKLVTDIAKKAAERDRTLSLLKPYLHEGPLRIASRFISYHWDNVAVYLYNFY
ncbi:uncharacterized protein LOC111252543 [Varroa destructor]|uniref:Uncharacterized protein n=1 Tax=Varroa destructor TaxID=109461 RepID=A0A7M7MCK9_VARDE|nr:uncharacterized protein LOC111252543 [Varroa destructor]XP_022666396.1 uncharacterized protein LOC111252543 [Varroa destructor]